MKIKILSNKDAAWPTKLDNITRPPKQLFYRGEIGEGPFIGVIGSRRPSSYGEHVVDSVVKPLAAAGATIVSGLAIGIDGLSHRAAIEAGGRTIAVLPCSIDTVYPARHKQLAQRIIKNGAIVSEYRDEQPIHKSHFIARNRLIASMCDFLLVVEAAHQSGTMHTVNFATSIGTDVGAIPGPIYNVYSNGTNQLIKDGAYAVTAAEDILEHLQMSLSTPQDSGLSPEQTSLLDQLGREPRFLTELAAKAGLSQPDTLTVITELEINNLVARLHNGMYARR